MKKPVLALLAAFVLIASCKKIKEVAQQATIITKNVEYNEEIAIPDNPGIPLPVGGVKVGLPAFGSPTYIGDFLKENNTTTDRLISAKPSRLGIKLLTPPTSNLDYVDSLWIYISAKGLPETLAAYKYPIPKGTKEIDGSVVDKDFKEYFVKDTLYYRVEGHFTKYPDSSTTLQLYGTFKVQASPITTN
ncbi:hypothetical protein CAP35_09820 [Chitinophagaceae bacterium IBVUCB1]|nr:hypothetical protein CAP35_09820 [Chitinophagaceae bacterium IBVUCB1]